jgi:hypothetical protein
MTLVFFTGATDTAYAVFNLTGESTDANGFFLAGNSAVPGVGLTFSNDTLQNGADAVALYSGLFPVGGIVTTSNLIDAIVYDTNDADDAGLLILLDDSTVAQPQVNEAQGGTGDTKSSSRVPDGGEQRKTTTYVVQAPTPGTFNVPQPYGIEFVHSGSHVDVQEGGATDSYQIALQSIPTNDVQITIDTDDQTDLGLGAGMPIMLLFTPANALIPQTIAVTAVDDLFIEGVHTSTITHMSSSLDSKYNGLVISDVVATIVDNDIPPPTSIVISELMYNPGNEGGAASPEWIEVVNTGAGAVNLGGWLFDDEDATNWGAIPAGTILSPNQIAVFFDASFTTAAAFRSAWAVPASALVVGISWGSLGNTPAPANEVLRLFDNFGVQRDIVDYDDTTPWPPSSDGPSIYLKNLAADNNVGSNWARSTAVAKAVSPTGGVYSASDVGSPGRVFLAGDYNANGAVDAADFTLWRNTLGQAGPNLPADGSGPTFGTPNGIVDQADYTFWRSNFGAIGVPNGGLGTGGAFADGPTDETPSNAFAINTASSTSSSSSLPLPASSRESTAVDAAFSDDSENTLPTRAGRQPRQRWLGRVGPVAAESVDPLLIRLEPATSRRVKQELAAKDKWADSSCDDIDQLFASLDDVAILYGARRFSTI